MANPTKEEIHRDLNAHREARLARLLYNNEYAAQRGGQHTFWKGLSKGEKQTVRECLDELEKWPREKKK